MIRLRKEAPEIGWGDFRVLDGGDDAVLVLEHRWNDRTTITAHNFAAKATTVSIPVRVKADRLRDRFGSSAPTDVEDGTASVEVDAHGYHWFAVESDL